MASQHRQSSEKITERYVLWAMGGGLIPIPLLDLAAIVGTQIKMLSEISALYDKPFSDNRAKMVVIPLVSSVGLAPAGVTLLGSLSKVVPVVGQALSGVAMPIFAGGITLATSRVFVAHFESGGTLLDFKPEQSREQFKAAFESSKVAAEAMLQKMRMRGFDLSTATVDGEPILPPLPTLSAGTATVKPVAQGQAKQRQSEQKPAEKKVAPKKKRVVKKKVPPLKKNPESPLRSLKSKKVG